MTQHKASGKWVWVLVIALIILHQDIWFWDNSTLVFGVVPIGLFYHVCISIGAGVTWYLATKFAWPLDEEETPAGGGAA